MRQRRVRSRATATDAGGPHVGAHEVDCGVGRRPDATLDAVLAPHEHPVDHDAGQLHRPAVVVAIAQRRAGAGEPEVVGVEVGGLQEQRIAFDGDEPAASVEIGQPEPGRW